ncbi:family 43 glycosylhydrolase [Maribellus comscasis]|uniref:Family 43 glycosylhydrolase n=1 Tax=Maribellus comscasis TaxID=2681766 RepID=A0A6I6JWK8_9BACT|nr:family 43 glycosylhydrolase [Maribellus comscasis]QGY47516.1 family 43 glycosylhydrolase [Maribellus comscasis]
MFKRLLTIIFLAFLFACGHEKLQTFSYQNPISKGIDEKGLRDCQVLKEGDWWYLTGTAWPHWAREEKNGNLNQGVPLYKSKDLKQWQFIKYIVLRPDSNSWYYRRFWAPEVHKINEKYYATFNCRNSNLGYNWQQMGYAVADNIEGPYEVVTKDKPLAQGNDLTFFEDTDGKVYAFWHNIDEEGEYWMGSAEIDLDNAKFISEPKMAITTGKRDVKMDEDGTPVKIYQVGRYQKVVTKCYEWDSAHIEGAYVIKRNGIYYLFYSSNTRGYEIGYATATNINGPWVKGRNNPIYGAKIKERSEARGFAFDDDPDSPFQQVGHNEVFTGYDGRLWISCHGINKITKKPFLVIDPIDFNEKGEILQRKPSYTIQTITWKK